MVPTATVVGCTSCAYDALRIDHTIKAVQIGHRIVAPQVLSLCLVQLQV
jgi:hypothetical protein